MKRKIMLVSLVIGMTSVAMIGCTSNKVETQPNQNQTITETEKENEEKGIDVSKFIPTGTYAVSFKGSDMANELITINGNGTLYQAVGMNGKGYYHETYKLVNDNLLFVENEELEDSDEEPSMNITLDVNLDEKLENYETVLKPEFDKGDKIQISKVGNDLKLEKIQLKGEYVVTTKDISDKETKTVVNTYYSEGLGIVKYEVVMNDEVVEYSELTSYEKLR